MPKLGMAMKKGTLKRWLVAEGGAVELGKPLLEVMTEKINAVVESPASGVLGRVVVAPNTELPVGALLALIGEAGDVFPPAQELGQAGQPGGPGQPVAAAAPAAAPEVLASPAARRLARDLGIDIAEVAPSTAGKRITTDDVEAFAAVGGAAVAAPVAPEVAPIAAAAAGRAIPFTGIRKVVAER